MYLFLFSESSSATIRWEQRKYSQHCIKSEMEMPRNFTSIQSGNKYCCSEWVREREIPRGMKRREEGEKKKCLKNTISGIFMELFLGIANVCLSRLRRKVCVCMFASNEEKQLTFLSRVFINCVTNFQIFAVTFVCTSGKSAERESKGMKMTRPERKKNWSEKRKIK